jgi:hypothetical protein
MLILPRHALDKHRELNLNGGVVCRLGLLMVYRRPDPKGRLRSCDRNIPDEWVHLRAREPAAAAATATTGDGTGGGQSRSGRRLTATEVRLFSEY